MHKGKIILTPYTRKKYYKLVRLFTQDTQMVTNEARDSQFCDRIPRLLCLKLKCLTRCILITFFIIPTEHHTLHPESSYIHQLTLSKRQLKGDISNFNEISGGHSLQTPDTNITSIWFPLWLERYFHGSTNIGSHSKDEKECMIHISIILSHLMA